MVDFSQRLAEAMQDAGETASSFAKKMGLSYTAIKKLLNGQSKSFDAPNNAKAAGILGVYSDWLATGIGPKKTESHPLGNCPLVTITFSEDGALHFKAALEFAMDRGAAKPETIGHMTRYTASFPRTLDGANAALQLLGYLGRENSAVFIHANGRIIYTQNALDILNCFVNSCASDDVASYCSASFNHQPLPCAMLLKPSHDPDFFDGNEDQIVRHIQAAATRAECEWCPHFKIERIKGKI